MTTTTAVSDADRKALADAAKNLKSIAATLQEQSPVALAYPARRGMLGPIRSNQVRLGETPALRGGHPAGVPAPGR
jgi:hypothetical protein